VPVWAARLPARRQHPTYGHLVERQLDKVSKVAAGRREREVAEKRGADVPGALQGDLIGAAHVAVQRPVADGASAGLVAAVRAVRPSVAEAVEGHAAGSRSAGAPSPAAPAGQLRDATGGARGRRQEQQQQQQQRGRGRRRGRRLRRRADAKHRRSATKTTIRPFITKMTRKLADIFLLWRKKLVSATSPH